jgi:hypothetical protein
MLLISQEVILKSYMAVDDQIWQVWENRTIRFEKPEYPVLIDLEQDQRRD